MQTGELSVPGVRGKTPAREQKQGVAQGCACRIAACWDGRQLCCSIHLPALWICLSDGCMQNKVLSR